MKIAKNAKKKLGKVRRGLRQKLIFKMMGAMQKSGLGTPKDADYWKEKDWI